MAFSKGKQSTDAPVFSKYTGVGTVEVLGVNPTLAELNKIYDKEFTEEPKYLDKDSDGADRIRIDFYFKTDAEKHLNADKTPLDLISKVSIYLTNKPFISKDGSKMQVIDVYGNTAWVTPEELAAKAIPQYSNGPATIAEYRQAYMGEENLIKFLKAYININQATTWDKVTKTVKWKDAAELEDCKASLDHIADYFKGNISELKDIVASQPKNRVKVLFGIRTQNDGTMYQCVYNNMFSKTSNTNAANNFKKDVEDNKSRNGIPNEEYTFDELHEYSVKATNFEAPKAASTEVPW